MILRFTCLIEMRGLTPTLFKYIDIERFTISGRKILPQRNWNGNTNLIIYIYDELIVFMFDFANLKMKICSVFIYNKHPIILYFHHIIRRFSDMLIMRPFVHSISVKIIFNHTFYVTHNYYYFFCILITHSPIKIIFL